MDAIITYIEELAQISPYIKLYRDFNSNVYTYTPQDFAV